MSKAPLLLLGGLAALAALGGGGAAVHVQRRRMRSKRKPVTNAAPDAHGIVRANPAVLAKQAGVSLDVYALARAIASEHPNSSELVKMAVAWVTQNNARRRGVSVASLLLAPNGLFARQNATVNGKHLGKYAATGNDPIAQEIAIAGKVLSGAVADPTGGAVQFDSPRAQRAALARKVKGYRKTPEQVAAERMKEGKVLVTLTGVDPDYLRFWRPRAGAAVAMRKTGKKGAV